MAGNNGERFIHGWDLLTAWRWGVNTFEKEKEDRLEEHAVPTAAMQRKDEIRRGLAR